MDELAGENRERVTGIEPAWPAWKAGALPLSYTREVLAQPNRRRERHTCGVSGATTAVASATQAGLLVVAPDDAGRVQRTAFLTGPGPVDLHDLARPKTA